MCSNWVSTEGGLAQARGQERTAPHRATGTGRQALTCHRHGRTRHTAHAQPHRKATSYPTSVPREVESAHLVNIGPCGHGEGVVDRAQGERSDVVTGLVCARPFGLFTPSHPSQHFTLASQTLHILHFSYVVSEDDGCATIYLRNLAVIYRF